MQWGTNRRSLLRYALSKNIPSKGRQHRDLSTALRFGRDDKGEGGAPMGERTRTKGVFSSPWVGRKPMTPPVGVCDFLSSVVVCGRKAAKSICQGSIAGVLRLRAIKPSLCDGSAKR